MDMSLLKDWKGDGPIEGHLDFLDGLCKMYRFADSDERESIREAIRHNPNIYSALLYDSNAAVGSGRYLAVIANTRRSEDYPAYLEAALTVISITGGFGDSRDSLMWLDRLWLDAEKHGVNPRPFFERSACLSDTTENRHRMYGGSTQGMILQSMEFSPSTGKFRNEESHPGSDEATDVTDKPILSKPWWRFW